MQPPHDRTMLGMMQMLQQMMQVMMSLQQTTQGAAASGTSPPTASSPVGATHWKQHTQMASVRLDERAFRRMDKFSNKKSEWKEWRIQLLTAIRECDTTFATALVAYERLDTDPATAFAHVAIEVDRCHCQGSFRQCGCDTRRRHRSLASTGEEVRP